LFLVDFHRRVTDDQRHRKGLIHRVSTVDRDDAPILENRPSRNTDAEILTDETLFCIIVPIYE
jgi:hypothetical protein